MSPRKMFSKLAQLLRRPSSLFQAAQPAARVPAVLQLESGLKLDLTQPLTLGPTPVSTLDVIARDYEMSASHIEIIPGATPGMQVLDYCAGAGGKTLALSAAMENHGQIFAHDSEKQRLAPIFDRLRRADSRNVQVMAKPAELAGLNGRMDIVLVDAPCTGSGTWRRRPDAKWRLTRRQLDVRKGEQAAILDAAAAFVKPGGRLVYITCSVFEEENGDQIDAFVGRAPGFSVADHAGLWREMFPGHEGQALIRGNGISLTPVLTGTDGFFVSVLRKAG